MAASKKASKKKQIGEAGQALVEFKPVTLKTTLRRVTMQPGDVVPPYHIEKGYVVFTLSQKRAKVRRTTYKKGRKPLIEDIVLDPKVPFFVAGFAPGIQVSIKNISNGIVTCGKIIIDDDIFDW